MVFFENESVKRTVVTSKRGRKPRKISSKDISVKSQQ